MLELYCGSFLKPKIRYAITLMSQALALTLLRLPCFVWCPCLRSKLQS